MAVGPFSSVAPSMAAAVGLYFFGHSQMKTKLITDNPSGSSSNNKVSSNEKQEKIQEANLLRCALELDGLQCFETLVAQ
ncbi:hypothetical protein MRB53_025764 [Persea americana]|uniref:Uncharacterized protein n=1 Tax=Persea americana TaxID=3435 RepID=A0ACC2LH39_PERAE|nr:hypothetical protein MRB53_025764 [Persea americana]